MDVAQMKEGLDRLLDGGTPADTKQQKRRLAILDAATELFVANGYKRTSMSDVAERSGVSKPTIYAYYESKAHLLLHAIALEERNYFDRIEPIFDATATAAERLRRLVEVSLQLAVEMPLTSRLLHGERETLFALGELEDAQRILDPDGVQADAFRTWFHERLLEEAAPHLDEVERRERAKVLVALSYCSVVLSDEEMRQGLSYDRMTSLLASMVIGGIEVPTP